MHVRGGTHCPVWAAKVPGVLLDLVVVVARACLVCVVGVVSDVVPAVVVGVCVRVLQCLRARALLCTFVLGCKLFVFPRVLAPFLPVRSFAPRGAQESDDLELGWISQAQ